MITKAATRRLHLRIAQQIAHYLPQVISSSPRSRVQLVNRRRVQFEFTCCLGHSNRKLSLSEHKIRYKLPRTEVFVISWTPTGNEVSVRTDGVEEISSLTDSTHSGKVGTEQGIDTRANLDVVKLDKIRTETCAWINTSCGRPARCVLWTNGY